MGPNNEQDIDIGELSWMLEDERVIEPPQEQTWGEYINDESNFED